MMLISAWAFKCSSLRSKPEQTVLRGHCALVRYISTNSAINRGIRKSRNVDSRNQIPTRVGSFSRRRDPEVTKEMTDFRRHRREYRSSKEQDTSINVKSSTPSQWSHVSTRGRNTPVKSTSLNRAQRRALKFGHKESPPEDYKALNFNANKSTTATRSARESNWPGKPSYSSNQQTTRFIRKSQPESFDNESSERPVSLEMSKAKHHGELDRRSLHRSEESSRRKSSAPLVLPYTTPASEFLYGHSVVTSALRSSRRKLYKLYLYNGETAEVRGQDQQVRKLALAAGVEVTRVGHDWLGVMDKMSGGRPHNGYILEASPLPKMPVTGLRSMDKPHSAFQVLLDHQSQEEESVNGNSRFVPYGSSFSRFPFLLLLDGIRDPGNLGAILRSAYFLGVDAILICSRNSVGLTPVALKSAAGAAEELAILSVSQPGSFIESCQQNGWKFYAASPSKASNPAVVGHDVPHCSTATLGNPTHSHPCILMLGGEGEGLRWTIQKKADYSVSIEGQRAGLGELDSLNVSVAAGILSEAFMRPPAAPALIEKIMSVPRLDDGPVTKSNGTGFDITGIDDGRSSDGVPSDRLF